MTCVLGLVCACALIATATAAARSGALTQKPGEAGCLDSGSEDACADVTGLVAGKAVAVSPDGRNVYVATDGGVVGFDRASDGTLTQRPSGGGCISVRPVEGCRDGHELYEANAMTVSPDGESVYVATDYSVVVLDRAADGSLAQPPGSAGCISRGRRQDCASATVTSFVAVRGLAVSPDGTSVYVASGGSAGRGGLTQFRRAIGGTHGVKPGGCLSEDSPRNGCRAARGLYTADAVAVSPDGESVYAGSWVGNVVAILDRERDGSLTQKAGRAGCLSHQDVLGGCRHSRFEDPVSIAVSPNGANVYVSFSGTDSVAVFDRAKDGALTLKRGTAGCVSDKLAWCRAGRGLLGAGAVTVSPDGASVYVATFLGVATFHRAADGTLTQLPGRAGCVESGESTSGCAGASGLQRGESVAISPDGRSIYLASASDPAYTGLPGTPGYEPPGPSPDGAVLVFDRQPPPPAAAALAWPVVVGAALLLCAGAALVVVLRRRRRRAAARAAPPPAD